MIADVANEQIIHSKKLSETRRKELGQFFTGHKIAEYMASMISPFNEKIVRILDAGAGTGILTISAAIQCLKHGNKHVHAVLYEVDEEILPSLKHNMEKVIEYFNEFGGKFTFEIRPEDFVLARPDRTEPFFHIALINPPYFKYNSKTSPYAKATTDLYNGNPNIYASFMAIVAASIAHNGQMIAIIPRSFTNGLYFKGFRRYLNREMNLEKIHVFKARNQLFRELSVLQENIICSYFKGNITNQEVIEIRSSKGCEDFDQIESNYYPRSKIIDLSNPNEIIRIPESNEDSNILDKIEKWPSSFTQNGYFVSTGPVVEHRTREYILSPENTLNSVPLFRMHNVKAFKTVWTGTNKKDARFLLSDDYKKHTSANQLYVILKRFSSKEEKRRLVVGVHHPHLFSEPLIALENHLNYIAHQSDSFDENEAYGLALLLNSTLLDRYFRCISGSTQINATEIRLLKLPYRNDIRQLGKKFLSCSNIDSQEKIDELLEQFLTNN